MDFRLLQLRLVANMQARVRNGEMSERGLSRLTGISQPHIHNVQKGARVLSINMADRILERLHLDLVDLLTSGDTVAERQAGFVSDACRMVPLLEGWIGSDQPFPETAGRERYPFLAIDVERLEDPAAARLAPDPRRLPLFSAGGVVLLDRSEASRLRPDENGYFAIALPGGGTIGLVRHAGRRLYLWTRSADVWQSTALPDGEPREVIRARVRLLVQRL